MSNLDDGVFVLAMLRSSFGAQKRAYLLAFNAKAKARPNFGLRGVGYWTSDVYHNSSSNFWGCIVIGSPMVVIGSLMYNNVFALVDDIGGGGPKHITPQDYGVNQYADKPWDFRFGHGEGFAAGPPTYRPAEGAIPLH